MSNKLLLLKVATAVLQLDCCLLLVSSITLTYDQDEEGEEDVVVSQGEGHRLRVGTGGGGSPGVLVGRHPTVLAPTQLYTI